MKNLFKFILFTSGIACGGLILLRLHETHPDPIFAGSPTTLRDVGALLFFVAPIFAGLRLWLDLSFEDKKHARIERRYLIDCVDYYRDTLSRNLAELVERNDYGAILKDERHKALKEFFESIELDHDAIEFNEAEQIVYRHLDATDHQDIHGDIDEGQAEQLAEIQSDEASEYRKRIVDSLQEHGWTTEVTPDSGENGIDIVAERGGRRLGIQCRPTHNAICNTAIKQAHLGRALHKAEAAIVLSDAPCTDSARALARVSGVPLLSEQELPKVFDRVFGQRNVA